MYDLRTVSMEDALKRNEVFEHTQGVRFVDYQPGNGTSYRFFLTWVEPGSAFGLWLGFGQSEGWIVSWVPDQSHHYNNVHIVASGGYLDPHYVKDKLGCGISDAVVLAEVFAYLTGRTTKSSEEFAKQIFDARPFGVEPE